MSQEIKNVLLVGAGGNLGPSIIKALEKDSGFTISVLAREGSTKTFPSHIKVRTVDESWPEDQLVTALKGQDAVVHIVFTDVPKAKTLIDASVKAGVKRFVLSEYGIDPVNDAVVKKAPIVPSKREILDHAKSKESSNWTWSGVVNGVFFDWALNAGFLGFDLKSRTATIYDGGDGPINGTNLSSVAAATVWILRNPDKSANRALYINTYKASPNEVLAALEKATGEKWKTTAASTDDLQKEGQEKLSQGDFSGIFPLLQAAIFSGDEDFDYAKLRGLDNEEIGLPKPEPLDVAVEKIVRGEEV